MPRKRRSTLEPLCVRIEQLHEADSWLPGGGRHERPRALLALGRRVSCEELLEAGHVASVEPPAIGEARPPGDLGEQASLRFTTLDDRFVTGIAASRELPESR